MEYKPYAHLDYGEPKVGKTDYLASVFESKYFSHEEILYLDNHGSTKGQDVPRYTAKTPYGVKDMPGGDPSLFTKEVDKIVSNIAKDKNKIKVLILDDLSEHASAAIAKLMKENPSSGMRNWGVHLDNMTDPMRRVMPDRTGLIVLMSARAARMADLLEDKAKLLDGGQDNPATVVRPLLQGQFGAWALFEFDLTSLHTVESKGERLTFSIDCWPHQDRTTGCRFLKQWRRLKIPRKVDDPTFDSVFEIMQQVIPGTVDKIDNEDDN